MGTDRSGTKDLGNDSDGIYLESASGATVGGTTNGDTSEFSAPKKVAS